MSKSTYGLILCAGILCLAIFTRLDSRFFKFSTSRKEIQSKMNATAAKSKEARSNFESIYAVIENPKQYVLTDLSLVSTNKAPDGTPVVDMDVLRVTGLMRSGGVLVALVNGSTVSPGDSVRGCEVVEVDKDGVVFLIDGKHVKVNKNSEIQFTMVKTERLTFEQVISQEGRNIAIINGRSYKTGDWVDGEIQVKAISPTVVMLFVRGENKRLRVGETL